MYIFVFFGLFTVLPLAIHLNYNILKFCCKQQTVCCLPLRNVLYCSPNIARAIKLRMWAGHVAFMAESRGIYRVVVGKPEGKRTLGRPLLRKVSIRKYKV